MFLLWVDGSPGCYPLLVGQRDISCFDQSVDLKSACQDGGMIPTEIFMLHEDCTYKTGKEHGPRLIHDPAMRIIILQATRSKYETESVMPRTEITCG